MRVLLGVGFLALFILFLIGLVYLFAEGYRRSQQKKRESRKGSSMNRLYDYQDQLNNKKHNLQMKKMEENVKFSLDEADEREQLIRQMIDESYTQLKKDN